VSLPLNRAASFANWQFRLAYVETVAGVCAWESPLQHFHDATPGTNNGAGYARLTYDPDSDPCVATLTVRLKPSSSAALTIATYTAADPYSTFTKVSGDAALPATLELSLAPCDSVRPCDAADEFCLHYTDSVAGAQTSTLSLLDLGDEYSHWVSNYGGGSGVDGTIFRLNLAAGEDAWLFVQGVFFGNLAVYTGAIDCASGGTLTFRAGTPTNPWDGGAWPATITIDGGACP
jgi:hypothetical protein